MNAKTLKQAMAACGSALVGTGTAKVNISAPGRHNRVCSGLQRDRLRQAGVGAVRVGDSEILLQLR